MLDAAGTPRSAFVSARRDGTVWVRVGRDHVALQWVYRDEQRSHFQFDILDDSDLQLLRVRRTHVRGWRAA